MKYSTIHFKQTAVPGIVVDTLCIATDEKVALEPTHCLFNVGNTSSERLNVHLAMKNASEKFTSTVEPATVVLSKRKAYEFVLTITPVCSCSIDETVGVVVTGCRSGRAKQFHVSLKMKTVPETKIHYSEIVQKHVLGEGSFCVVFFGTFRGNDVAVKKMKEVGVNEASMAEFEKDVAILDKFQCEQIVHFYGACFVPNHIMMVTEFAPCGSLMDCIKK